VRGKRLLKNSLLSKTRLMFLLLITTLLVAPPVAFASPASVKPSPLGYVTPVSYPQRSQITGMTCSSNCTFVTDLGSNLLQVLSSSGKLVTTITLPSSGCGYGATQVGQNVWVDDYCLGQLDKVSATTLSYVTSYGLAGAIFSAYAPSSGMLYVSQFGYGTVTPFNPLTGTFGSAIAVCGAYPEYIAYNGGSAGDGLIYVPARTGCYSTINPTSNTASNYNLGVYPNGVACSSATGNCYISDEDSSLNYVYEVKGGSTIATISNSNFDWLWGMAYNPIFGTVYVTSALNNAVVVISGGSVTNTITMKSEADANCFKNGKVVTPMLLVATTSGLGQYSVVWTTPLGQGVIGPESCG
jgi:DNA-binding beta-propeller fold protein YncE